MKKEELYMKTLGKYSKCYNKILKLIVNLKLLKKVKNNKNKIIIVFKINQDYKIMDLLKLASFKINIIIYKKD